MAHLREWAPDAALSLSVLAARTRLATVRHSDHLRVVASHMLAVDKSGPDAGLAGEALAAPVAAGAVVDVLEGAHLD